MLLGANWKAASAKAILDSSSERILELAGPIKDLRVLFAPAIAEPFRFLAIGANGSKGSSGPEASTPLTTLAIRSLQPRLQLLRERRRCEQKLVQCLLPSRAAVDPHRKRNRSHLLQPTMTAKFASSEQVPSSKQVPVSLAGHVRQAPRDVGPTPSLAWPLLRLMPSQLPQLASRRESCRPHGLLPSLL